MWQLDATIGTGTFLLNYRRKHLASTLLVWVNIYDTARGSL